MEFWSLYSQEKDKISAQILAYEGHHFTPEEKERLSMDK